VSCIDFIERLLLEQYIYSSRYRIVLALLRLKLPMLGPQALSMRTVSGPIHSVASLASNVLYWHMTITTSVLVI
jgi:hypothetical protein